jgi:hypothetical protein
VYGDNFADGGGSASGGGADVIGAFDGADIVHAGPGNDNVRGDAANDTACGSFGCTSGHIAAGGADTLYGEGDNDTLRGYWTSSDVCDGGSGTDSTPDTQYTDANGNTQTLLLGGCESRPNVP